MKKIIIITLLSTGIIHAETTTGNNPMNEIIPLLQTLIAKHPWPPNDAIKEAKFFESAEFVQLKAVCKTHWRLILDDLDAVAGGDAGKIMLFTAFEDLDADSYMTALERLAEKFQQNQINKTTAMGAVLYPYGRMQVFLVDNYRHTHVQTLLNALRPCFDGDALTQRNIDDILSGNSKKMLDEDRETYEGLERIPKVTLERSRVAHPTVREAVRPSTITQNEPDGVPENQRSGFDATAKREQPQNDPATNKGTPWKLPLLIGGAAAVALAAWLRFRKK